MNKRPVSSAVVAVFLALLAIRAPMGLAWADGFFMDIDDLPLMQGLAESADGSMIFDSGAGRIVESFAEGNVGKQAVLDFYGATLPQLGWQQYAPGIFKREGETLKLAFPDTETISGKDKARPLTVRFTLSPAKE